MDLKIIKDISEDFAEAITKNRDSKYELVLLFSNEYMFASQPYSLIMSAEWLDAYSSKELLTKLIPIMERHFKNYDSIISGMLFVNSNNTFIENTNFSMQRNFGDYLEVTDMFIAGYEIKKGYIIRSKYEWTVSETFIEKNEEYFRK